MVHLALNEVDDEHVQYRPRDEPVVCRLGRWRPILGRACRRTFGCGRE
jgi:hypothetical protein